MILRVAPPQDAPYTVEDLHAMPDDGNRYELLFGEIVMSPSPSKSHQDLVLRIALSLRVAVDDRGEVVVAPFDVHLGPHTVVQPDVLLVLDGGSTRVEEDGVHGAPDLVVEVLSPATRGQDLVKKAVLYGDAGVSEYWVVDPERRVLTVKTLRDGQYTDTTFESGIARSSLVPDLSIDLAALFAPRQRKSAREQ